MNDTINILKGVISSKSFDVKDMKLKGAYADMISMKDLATMAAQVCIEKEQLISERRNDKFDFDDLEDLISFDRFNFNFAEILSGNSVLSKAYKTVNA